MLILLPPSEAKAEPRRRGRPVQPGSLSLAELDTTRARVRSALQEVSGRPDALQLLGLGERLAPELQRNLALDRSPAVGALEVYTGVLYEALGHQTLSAAARRRAARVLRVQSALWGPVAPADRIAPYRLSMGATLPQLGPLASAWRSVLAGPMAALAGDAVVVDCRSAPYAAAWLPSGEAVRSLLAVRVFTEVAGRRTVVSHLAKQTRGEVVRSLLEHPGRLRSVRDVAEVVAGTHRCEVVDHGRRGFSLDVLR